MLSYFIIVIEMLFERSSIINFAIRIISSSIPTSTIVVGFNFRIYYVLRLTLEHLG